MPRFQVPGHVLPIEQQQATTPVPPPVPGPVVNPNPPGSGLIGFFSNTVNLAGYDIPMWALCAVAIGGYVMFGRDGKK